MTVFGVIARRGIQAIQLTYANRVEVTDLVKGRLHQHGRIDRAAAELMSFSFEIELPNGTMMRERQWLVISAEGFVAVMDDDTFTAWFETVSLTDALDASVTRQNDPRRP
jgi:hypothetical protein